VHGSPEHYMVQGATSNGLQIVNLAMQNSQWR